MSRGAFTPHAYQLLSVAEKMARSLAVAREQPVRCPACSMACVVEQLLAHVRERCEGRPEPGPLARWLTWREAVAMGLPKTGLHRATAQGHVRAHGPLKRRLYLARDVVLEVARRAMVARGSHASARDATAQPEVLSSRTAQPDAPGEALAGPPPPGGDRVLPRGAPTAGGGARGIRLAARAAKIG